VSYYQLKEHYNIPQDDLWVITKSETKVIPAGAFIIEKGSTFTRQKM
jgi:hypothetical protein